MALVTRLVFLQDSNKKEGDIIVAAPSFKDWFIRSSRDRKDGPLYYWVCKCFVGAYDPIGACCDIGQGYLGKDAGMYGKGLINMFMTSTDSEVYNMIWGGLDLLNR